MPNPSLQEPGDSQHGARRIPVASQVAKSYHQQVQQRHEGPGVLHANGIGGLPNARDAEFWLRRAAVHESENQPEEAERVLMEALTRDVQPVTSVARALHELHLRKEDGSAIKSMITLPTFLAPGSTVRPATGPRALTPSRTGLTGQAVRVPSALAKTPGAAAAPSAAVPPPTKYRSILKKLEFSTAAKPGDAPAAPSGALPAAAPAPQQPQTTTKRLMFDRVRDTPVDMVARTTDALLMSQPHGRRVTFGAATASPSAPRPHRASFAAFQTPTAISEGDGSGSDADGGGDGVAGGSVNSHHAGATPFDRRLSAKFAKYGVGDGALDDEFQPFQDGAGPEGINVSGQIEKEGAAAVSEDDMDVSDASPASLRRLSGASAKKCIKELSKALAGVPPATQPAEASPATTPNTAIASVLGQLLRRSLEDIQAARAEGATCTTRPLLSGVISPTSGILRVAPEPPSSAKPDLAPVPSEPSTEHSQGGPSPGSMAATHSGTDCVATPDSAPSEVIDLSPASKGTTASTPELTPTASDGVPRDSWGVPIRTPGTVTLFRGTGGLPRRDDGIAADLTRCFTTPDTDPQADDRPGSGGFSFDLGRPRAAQGDMTPTPPSSGGDSSEGTPEFQPRSASRGGKRTSTAGVSGCSRPASIFRSPSAAPDDTAGMGKAQRVPSPAPVASVTRELRGLLRGMTLSSPSPGAEMTLSPVRAPHQLRQHTGASVVVTQVRRSPRLAARGDASQPGEGGVDALLQSVEYAYVPNAALQAEESTPVPESANKTAGRRKVATTTPTTGTPTHRYATRSATKTTGTAGLVVGSGGGSGAKSKPLKLSPTEQNIRDSLRRSSRRKSTAR